MTRSMPPSRGREIEAALAANDADLAQSFVDLAATRNVAIDPALAGKGDERHRRGRNGAP